MELPSDDHHAFAGDRDAISEIEQFLSEIHGGDTGLDRVLATVFFTDIVDPTSPDDLRASIRSTGLRTQRPFGVNMLLPRQRLSYKQPPSR